MKTSSWLVLASVVLTAACSSSKGSTGDPTATDLPAAPTDPASSGTPGQGVGSAGTAPNATAPNADDAGVPTDAGASKDGGAGTGTAVLTCCVNGLCFVCPDQAAMNKCVGFDLDGCFAACAKTDTQCIQDCVDQLDNAFPDPSGCKVQP